MPARSVLTVTPLTAFSEPTALSTGCHVCGFTTTVVTAAGGGANFAPIAFPARIVRYFAKAIPATARNTSSNITSIRFNIGGEVFRQRRFYEHNELPLDDDGAGEDVP